MSYRAYIHIEHTLRIIPRLVVVADLRAGITLVVSYLKRELKPINRLNIEVRTAHQGIAQRLIVVEVSQLDRIVVLTIGTGDTVVVDPIPAVIEDVCSRQRVVDMDRIDRSDSLGEVCTIGRSTTERARASERVCVSPMFVPSVSQGRISYERLARRL